MSEDVKYKVISVASQAPPPQPLNKKLVVLPEWPVKDPETGEMVASAYYVWELANGEHNEYAVSDRVFDDVGQVVRLKTTGDDHRFLAYTVRSEDGNRLFPTLKAAEDFFKPRGKHGVNKLLLAAREMNYGSQDTKSADEAVASAEGNSEETQTAA